jgi:putative membrane protein
MINYNPKDWFIAIFRFHKSDTFRSLAPLLIFIALYSWGIVYLETTYLKLSENSHAKNITIMHTLLGFAISMLLVFRTNTAYDRWWEGRKLWGSLVNNSRNLAVKMHTILPKENVSDRIFFKQMIPLFAFHLKRHLQKETTRLALDEKSHPEIPHFNDDAHVPMQVSLLMMRKTQELYTSKKITGDQLIILNVELQSFLDVSGACERIKNTPIPYSYSVFIKKFIFIYVITMPFGFAFNLGMYTIPVTTFIFYVLASLELIAEEIEDPFGNDSNDLPMHKIADNIKKNVHEIMEQ